MAWQDSSGNAERESEDMSLYSELTETAIVQGLEARYLGHLSGEPRIYTGVGDILLSVNPYEPMPRSYTAEMRRFYLSAADPLRSGGDRQEASPHIYLVAARAFHALLHDGHATNQSIVINGESGAGKTEATKHILSFLTFASGCTSEQDALGRLVGERILASNPILEAFGNAKTVRNDNSSRFGKLIKLLFDGRRRLVGSELTIYLLEKSRIARVGAGERNYHVFYQLVAGASPAERKAYRLLDRASDYRYLASRGRIDGVDDAAGFAAVQRALQTLQFDVRHVAAVWQLVSAVLALGNVTFDQVATGEEGSCVSPSGQAGLQTAAALLQVSPADLEHTLCHRSMGSANRSSVYTIPLSVAAAEDSRDALAKALYARLFDHLVAMINRVTSPPSPLAADGRSLPFIGVLDIFGFESFEHNSYEQLLINYANDKLFHHFNDHVFAAELADYHRERVPVHDIAYPDNHATLDLLEKRGTGLLHLLDEECVVPRGSDPSFVDKAHRQWHPASPAWQRPPKAPSPAHFAVVHFAGSVLYSAAGFLDKNKDSVHADLLACIAKSSSAFLRLIFQPTESPSPSPSTASSSAATAAAGSRKRSTTLSQQFRASLSELLALLQSTRPWFVRALKPNTDKQPRRFDSDEMTRQVRNAGILACVQIRQAGYSYREPYPLFLSRHQHLAPSSFFSSSSSASPSDRCQRLLRLLAIDPAAYWLGASKVFLRASAKRQLDGLCVARLTAAAVVLQKHVRGYFTRRRFVRLLAEHRERRRLEQERLEREQREREQRERERQERERQERDRLERERQERERQELEQQQRDKQAREREELERHHRGLRDLLTPPGRQHSPEAVAPLSSTATTAGTGYDAELERLREVERQAMLALEQSIEAERRARLELAKVSSHSADYLSTSKSVQHLPMRAVSTVPELSLHLSLGDGDAAGGDLAALALSPRRSDERGSQLAQLRGQYDSRKRSNTLEMLAQAKSRHQRSPSGSLQAASSTPALFGSGSSVTRKTSSTKAEEEGQAGDARVRAQVIAEILRTEEDYVRDLVLTIDVYMRPLRAAAQAELKVADADVLSIFSTLENLMPINRVVLDRLREVAALPFGEQCVGATFSELGDYLRLYSEYCTNQPEACALLQRLQRRNKRLDAYLDRVRRDTAELRGLSLEDYLIKPLQRLTRYPLLLRELLRHTASAHPDYAPLEAAIAKIQAVVAEVNERQRQVENTERLTELLRAFEKAASPVPFLKPTSRMLHDADLKMVVQTGRVKRRKLILFTDCLVIAKPAGANRLTYEKAVPMQALGVDRVARSECHFHNAFMVVQHHPSGDHEQNEFVVLVAKSAPARDHWIDKLEQTASDYRGKLELTRSHSGVKAQNLELLAKELASSGPGSPTRAQESPRQGGSPRAPLPSPRQLPAGQLSSFVGVSTGAVAQRYDTIRRRQFMENLRQTKVAECASTAADPNLAAPMNRRL